MPVKFKCPECHRMIAVPTKLVGTTINCPHNGCLVEVRAESVSHAHAGNGSVSHSSIPLKLADDVHESGDVPETMAGTPLQPGRAGVGLAPVPVQQGNWVRRNVARFIPGGSPSGPSPLVSEGRLPELKLQEGQTRRASETEATNPLVMVGVLCLSFVMSTALLIIDFDSPRSSNQQLQARKRLPEFYRTTGPLEPYQQYLRDAERAHSRGDEKTERQMYRKVLQLLRSEGRSRYESVTGRPSTDRELEEMLATLMAGN